MPLINLRSMSLVVLAALVLAVAGCRPQAPAPAALPSVQAYSQLPAEFGRALQDRHERAAAEADNVAAVRQLARLYHANRLYPEATACYRIVASREKLTAQDHYYLADIAQNSGDLESARKELEAVLALEPKYLPAQLALAATLFKSGSEAEAARLWTQVTAVEPDQPDAAVGLARFELQQGNDEAAVKRLESLVARHLESVSGAALLSQVLRRRGENERADALAQMSRQKHEPAPADSWMDALLADCFDVQLLSLAFEERVNRGQLEAALPLLDRVALLDPKSWIPHLLKGWTLARAHQDREALQQYQQALDKHGNAERVAPLVIASLLALDQRDDALTFAEQVHSSNPDSTDILTAYADLAVQTGREALAKTLLAKLLSKDPYLYKANMSLAKLLWPTTDRPEAVRCLERIRKVFPADVASRGLLAQHALEQHQPSAAIAPLEEALPVATGEAATERITEMLEGAYLQAAEEKMAASQFESALELYGKATRLVPTQSEALAGEANAAIQARQFSRALEALTRLAASQPANPTVQLSVGDVRFQNREPELARAAWQRALELTPASDSALRAALDERLSGRVPPELRP